MTRNQIVARIRALAQDRANLAATGTDGDARGPSQHLPTRSEAKAVFGQGRKPKAAPFDPAERLRENLADLGLDDWLITALADTVLACATVQHPYSSAEHDEANAASLGEGHASCPDQAASPGQDRPRPQGLLAQGEALLSSIQTLTAAAGQLDSVLLTATTELTAVTGKILLADKNVATPEELSKTARERWRAQAKRLTRHEIAAATGWGTGESADLVALANTPTSIQAPIHRGLRAGETTWRLARRYYRQTGPLDTEDAAAIATAFFGNNPEQAVTERLDSDKNLTGLPWSHREYYRALDRETHRITSRDPAASAKTREQKIADNDTRLSIDEDGTAALTIGTTATQGAAMMNRIDTAARAARTTGDPRTLQQLHVVVATALLLHGTLDLTDLPEDPALITARQSDQLTKILHGLPTAHLDVIVPLTTLLGTTPTGLAPMRTGSTGSAGPVDAAGNPIPDAFSSGSTGCTCQCTCGASRASTGQDRPPPGPTAQDRPLPGLTGQDCLPADELAPDVGIGEVVGAHQMFLSADQARTLALTPGSTLHRLVTDPVTGALIERSTTAYRFDTAMRAHIIAADVYCRAPGCLTPASRSQIDHAIEYGTPGGTTTISNGHPLHQGHHDLKTIKAWDAVLHANRDVTWTTLLGRIYRTKTHDYTQYTRALNTAISTIEDDIAEGNDPSYAVDHAIYQALSYRPPGSPLATTDDTDWDDHTEEFAAWDGITLTHTNPNGRRDYHPHPQAIRAEATLLHGNGQTDSQGEQDHQGEDSKHETGEHDHQGEDSKHETGEHNRQDGSRGKHGDDGPTTPWATPDDTPPPF